MCIFIYVYMYVCALTNNVTLTHTHKPASLLPIKILFEYPGRNSQTSVPQHMSHM